jgi:hypothetical protein
MFCTMMEEASHLHQCTLAVQISPAIFRKYPYVSLYEASFSTLQQEPSYMFNTT